MKRLLVLVGGPIASGKSTLSRAVTGRLRRAGTPAAAVDVDVVYELLEERGHSPGDPKLWRKAPGDGGDELLATARTASVRRITLRTSLETAVERVERDDDRGISRDRGFFSHHYEQVAPLLARRPGDELVVDTDELTVEETAERAASWLVGTRA